MSIESLDLRLLSVFDAIHTARSVSAAARNLKLGQPAVSIALAKLRTHFADPLFVRTPRGMEPTPLGVGLVGPVRDVLNAVDVVLGHRNAFDPATSQRIFRICMTDISQLVLLPRLWQTLHDVAPHIRIDILPMTEDSGRLLERGEADLAIGFMPQLGAGFFQTVLFAQSHVCMVSSSHPRIRKTLTLKQFQSEEHAVISSSGAAPLIVDQEIARLGLTRRISLRIPNFIGAALVVEGTELIITIPERLARVMQGRGTLRAFPTPFALPTYDIKLHWHERFHNDPGSQWLRRVIAELLTEAR